MKKKMSDYELFQHHVKYWMDRLSLNNYKPFFELEFMANEDASTTPDANDMSATFTLKDGELDNTVAYLARHECLEVVLGEIYTYLEKFYDCDFCKTLGHNVIHRLENILPLPTDEEVIPKRITSVSQKDNKRSTKR